MKRVILFLALFLIYVNGDTLWYQYNTNYANGILSSNFNENKNLTSADPTNYLVVAADDFTVPTGQTFTVNYAWFWGFFRNNTAATNVKNWTVTIWGNTNSIAYPGSNIPDSTNVLYNQTDSVSGFQQGSYNMTLTNPLTLSEGKYWIAMYPTMKGATMGLYWLNNRLGTAISGTEKWCWMETESFFFIDGYQGVWFPFDHNAYTVPNTNYTVGNGGQDLGFGLYGTAQDVQAPVVNKASLSSTSIVYPNPISFTVNVTDNKSGATSVSVRILSPTSYTTEVTLANNIGDELNGIWTGSHSFNISEPSGGWTVTGITTLDNSGNSKYFAGSNLTSVMSIRGFGLTGTTTTSSSTTSGSVTSSSSASATSSSVATSSTSSVSSTSSASSTGSSTSSASSTGSSTVSVSSTGSSSSVSSTVSGSSTSTGDATSGSSTGTSGSSPLVTIQFTTVNGTSMEQFISVISAILSISESRIQVKNYDLVSKRDMTYKSEFTISDDPNGLLANQLKNLADSGAFATYGWTGVSISAISPTTTGPSQITNPKSSEKSSNVGAIVGGVIGGVVAIAIIAVVAFFLLKKRNANKFKQDYASNNSSNNTTELQKVESQSSVTSNYGTLPSAPTSPASSKSPLPPSSNNPLPPAQPTTNYNAIPIPRDNRSFIDNIRIDYNELEIEKEIGKGAFGVVYKGRWRGGVVAIKQIQGHMSQKELEDFKMEAQTMKNLRPHVNVVQFLGVTLDPHPLCLVTEFLDQGSLYDYLQSESKVDANVIMNVVKGIAAGMLHLHREGIIHRDLAARNILLGSGFQVKISDFGLSRQNGNAQSNQTKSDTGPLKWMAPEAISKREYSTATDIWAFGVTVWEIVTRQEPYPDLDSVQTALAVVHNGLRLEIPSYCPVILARVMTSCFQTDPSQRPDFDIILKHLQSARLDEWTGGQTTETTNARPVSNTYDSMAAVQVNMNAPVAPVVNSNKHYSQFQ